MRTWLLALGAFLAFAAPAAADPLPSYTVQPNPPEAGAPATFRSTSTPDAGQPIQAVLWDLDGNGSFDASGQTVQYTYGAPGPRVIYMGVIDRNDAVTRPFRFVVNAPPVSQFGFSPASPVAGQEVFFQSSSFDPDGRVVLLEWDFDGDGDFNDGDPDETDAFGVATFATPGTRVVRLRVRDNVGAVRTVSRAVTVGASPANRLPVAQFAASPLRPRLGEQVSLRSFSYDADGSIVSQRWDLDGDGDFDENVNGASTFTVFSVPGRRIIRLQVRDSSGAVQTATQTILVRRGSGRAATSGVVLMNPFPVIRMAGSVYPRGALVKVLEAQAPPRSTVTARCEGASCPVEKIRKTAKKGVVRFKRMRGFLRAGAVVSVAVRKRAQIGKYTRWVIRGGKLPKRKDRCLYPGRRKPSSCPPV